MADVRIGLVGNPNCGKTTLFNALTGSRQRVGNWPGVTVDRRSGEWRIGDRDVEVVDLPGIYSLSASSLDERIARGFVLDGSADLIVNVVDASNLERNLYLTVQLLELGVPVVVVLNMVDLARRRGIEVDARMLGERLGCRVVELVAVRGEGLDELAGTVVEVARHAVATSAIMACDPAVELQVRVLERVLVRAGTTDLPPRWTALRLLEGDTVVEALVGDEVRAARDACAVAVAAEVGEEADVLIADARFELVGEVVDAAERRVRRLGVTATERIDRIVLNRVLGIPVFLTVMYAMFVVTINLGGAFIDLFDGLGNVFFVEGTRSLLGYLNAPAWAVTLLADGAGGGLQTVATFVPPIALMFLCLRVLEDSGYMARAAVVTDRFMRAIGLPGKAFVPMVVGFGCNVPAIMGTRTLESERDRRLAVAMNPFMSCGARLPVYVLFAAVFFPGAGQRVVFALYLTGIGAAVLTGVVLRRTMLRGELSPFVMELPPYHRPVVRNVVLGAWERLRLFLFGAGRIIVPMVVVLTVLGSVTATGRGTGGEADRSLLAGAGRTVTPLLSPLGVEDDNWPAAVGIFSGVLAKEAVVGSLNSLYAQVGSGREETGASTNGAGSGSKSGASFEIGAGVQAALATVGPNLQVAGAGVRDPLGLHAVATASAREAAGAQGVEHGTIGAMQALFAGQAGAFAYLLFVLLYMPCTAATAAIARECGSRWAGFVAAWTTGLAFAVSTAWFQLATLREHPGSSLAWLALIAVAGAAAVLLMRGAAIHEEALGAGMPGRARRRAARVRDLVTTSAPARTVGTIARSRPARAVTRRGCCDDADAPPVREREEVHT